MIEFIDRQSRTPYTYKIEHPDGTSEEVSIIRKDGVVITGTRLNRENFMAMQGFISNTTVFNSDGSITETNGKNEKLTTKFNSDGSITETFSGSKTITKTTTFNSDGSISEVIS